MPDITFDEAYFTGGRDYGYSNYNREVVPFFNYSEKLYNELQDQGIDPTGKSVLVAGCAYGFTVESLVNDWDVDAYGIDISQYAIDQTPDSISGRTMQGDVRNTSDLDSALQMAGVDGYDAIHTESLLSCLSDSDAETACTEMRKRCGVLTHEVWADENHLHAEYNQHTLNEWQSLCDSNGDDYWYAHHKDWKW